MPELPDITVYIEALEQRIIGHTLDQIRITNPFLVRSVEPPIRDTEGKRVVAIRRIGKRIAIGFDNDLWIVIHLMIAGRFRWLVRGSKVPGKLGLAAFDFDNGSLILTEAGSTRRASVTVVEGDEALQAVDRGGIEPLECSLEEFAEQLRRENHTLKRSLTDPTLFSGIGNAYSDEILHKGRLSPLRLTSKMSDEEIARLFEATQATLREWIDRLREEARDDFPKNVTAFREEMAVHGRYGKPCPVCETPVQRIRYASNETNYCPRCQTEGRLLADRAMSRLLKQDWPRSIDELY
ncbi:MAG TPA: DNA-formamidopyrimidine glycosylase family protein [Gemmatimonadaceae bacterium]|nr:DNA-formamidopyrimidine glycosylase family protein [Gemmatimonadaceae bacterium]